MFALPRCGLSLPASAAGVIAAEGFPSSLPADPGVALSRADDPTLMHWRGNTPSQPFEQINR